MTHARAGFGRFARCAARFVAALAIGAAASGASAEPVEYRLVPEASWISAEVVHFGTSTIRLRFGPIAGRVVLDRQARRGEVSVEIDTARVDSGIKPFDGRVREADVLSVAAFPRAWFVATQVNFDGDSPSEIRGEFTLRGIGHPLSLRAIRFGCRRDADGEVCGGDFEGVLRRSDFGIVLGLPFVADEVRLVVQVEGRPV